VARGTFQALQGGCIVLKTLATGLGPAASGRHIMVWAATPNVQSEWVSAGAAGQLESTDVMASLVNFAGNKLDWFLKETNTVKVQPAAGNTNVTVTMHLSNEVPSGQPAYVAGQGSQPGVAPNNYAALAAVNLPSSATAAT